ncbi:hypothetical protein D5086_009434 [Populus alba]|uniref:Uncharacterized protein n=1 Tax=Populus alba TaxID=43335 RepID=A0ACC4CIR5_POPAL
MAAQNPYSIIALLIIMLFNLAHLAFTDNMSSFTFERFVDDDHEKLLSFRGNSSIYLEALQLTPETPNDAHSWKQKNASGRIMYHKPFRFWIGDGGDGYRLASFNTTFVINIYRASDWEAGNGLAFLIAPNASIPEASYGQYLGLTNASTDGSTANHFVAIEFDTEKQDDIEDPDHNHIGFNINSIRSKNAIPLDKYNIILSPDPPGVNYTVWVDYNGTSKLMQVYMVKEGNQKPGEPLLNETIDLKEYLKQESYFGFAASTGDPQIELNCVLKWSLQINNQPDDENDEKWWKIGAGVCVSVVMIIFIFVVCGVVFVRRKRSKASLEEATEFGSYILKWLPGMPREFKYKELKKATSNFHESMKLGEGGFGIVYKGVLLLNDKADDGGTTTTTTTEIAVKKFSRDSIKSKDDFLAELTIIHHLRHKNLVRLVGPGTKIRHNQHLYSMVDWVWTLHRDGRILEAVDENLGNNFVHDEANRLLLLGLACSHPIDSERPKTETIIQIVSGTLPPPHVPPFKPAFTWPSMSTTDSTTGSLSSTTSSSRSYARTQSVIKLRRTSSSLQV